MGNNSQFLINYIVVNGKRDDKNGTFWQFCLVTTSPIDMFDSASKELGLFIQNQDRLYEKNLTFTKI